MKISGIRLRAAMAIVVFDLQGIGGMTQDNLALEGRMITRCDQLPSQGFLDGELVMGDNIDCTGQLMRSAERMGLFLLHSGGTIDFEVDDWHPSSTIATQEDNHGLVVLQEKDGAVLNALYTNESIIAVANSATHPVQDEAPDDSSLLLETSTLITCEYLGETRAIMIREKIGEDDEKKRLVRKGVGQQETKVTDDSGGWLPFGRNGVIRRRAREQEVSMDGSVARGLRGRSLFGYGPRGANRALHVTADGLVSSMREGQVN